MTPAPPKPLLDALLSGGPMTDSALILKVRALGYSMHEAMDHVGRYLLVGLEDGTVERLAGNSVYRKKA